VSIPSISAIIVTLGSARSSQQNTPGFGQFSNTVGGLVGVATDIGMGFSQSIAEPLTQSVRVGDVVISLEP
jgi:hypothetical protein